ncbi:hypothetical protein FA13DRAFT_1750107, partial [Coprinellus micaceus]
SSQPSFFVPPSLKYLERVWGSIEILQIHRRYISLSNVIAFGLNWIEYTALRTRSSCSAMPYHGQTALQILIPEHNVQLMGVIRVRVKTVDLSFARRPSHGLPYLSTVLCIVGFQNPWILIQFGWFVSWKTTVDSINGVTYGDRSDTFSLISWFPPFMQYARSYWRSTPRHTLAIQGGELFKYAVVESPLTNAPRAMALKALDQRVANTSSPVGSSSSNASRAGQPSMPRSDSASSQGSTSTSGGAGKSTDAPTTHNLAHKDW